MLLLLSKLQRQSHFRHAIYRVKDVSELIILQTGVVMDNPPLGRNFGDVLIAPLATYKVGDSAVAQFVAANPRVSTRIVCARGLVLIRTDRRIT